MYSQYFYPWRFLVALLLLSQAYWAAAENGESSKTFGDYEVFYSVLNSTFLKPEIAGRYGITRGKNRAIINIAVRKQLPTGESAPHQVEISGSSSDLIHSIPLQFTEFKEQDAIYYIAELKFLDKEIRSFDIKIKPAPDIAAYSLKFTKTLYVDE